MVTIEKEKDIVLLVENAIHKLKGVKEYTEKENKQVVCNLAKDLEGIIPMGTICMEIISRLHDHLSSRTIRKYLDEKYKVKSRVENARKQKTGQSSLAALGPLNKVSDTVVIDGRDKISFQEGNNQQTNQPSEVYVGEDNVSIRSVAQIESLSSTEQNPSSICQDNTGLTKCLGCIDKEERIKELEEAFENVQQFTAADKMRPAADAETENLKEMLEEPIEFEVSKKELEIRNYINKIIYPGAIWFNGRIDRKSGKIIYFGLGRLDQLRQKSVPNHNLD